MFLISKVEVKGFWGKYKASTSLHSDVNIFIGRNGSGKTTFMDLLQAVLQVDPRALASLDFQSITVSLRDKRKRQTITVTKQGPGDSPPNSILFQIDETTFVVPNYPREYYEDVFRHSSRNPASAEFNKLRRVIGELINISSLSIHRGSYEGINDDDEYLTPARARRVPVEQRLEGLVRKLTGYQLSLAERANQVSTNFQNEVLASMLYDEQFDKFDLEDARGTELGKEKEDLTRAYRELGALNKNVSDKIDRHIEALTRSLAALHDMETTRGQARGLRIEDIIPLPLFRRTQHIIDLSLKAQNSKQEIFQQIYKFVQIVGEFMEDKKVSIEANGDLIIRKDDKKIPISSLSSGEKQLLILLIETLLQKSDPFIFLADEPELSLHIDWQAKIISSIRDLNPHSQIIVATHSPEIAGGWNGKIIDMMEVIHA